MGSHAAIGWHPLLMNFEQATGNKLNIGYSLIADIRKRILDGETADVIILSRPVMDHGGRPRPRVDKNGARPLDRAPR